MALATYRWFASPDSSGGPGSAPAFGFLATRDQLRHVAGVLREEVKATVTSRECVGARVARAEVERILAGHQLFDWSVLLTPGLNRDDCVTAAISEADRRVLLLRARSRNLEAAIANVAARLLEGCYDEAGAVALLSTALSGQESPTFVVRTDGPLGAPPDLWAQTVRHVEAGCFVYSGAGWLPDGTPVYFLAGSRP